MQVSIHLGKRNTLTEISKAQIFVKQAFSIIYNFRLSEEQKKYLRKVLFKSFDNNVFDLHFVKSRNNVF